MNINLELVFQVSFPSRSCAKNLIVYFYDLFLYINNFFPSYPISYKKPYIIMNITKDHI